MLFSIFTKCFFDVSFTIVACYSFFLFAKNAHNIQERWKIDSGIGILRDQFRDEASNVLRFIDDISLLVLLWLIL